ncbi:MAG: HEAT repeat domain-containing protein [Gemmataceae bacterium]|nr:HEAT repeat domain-containing protein [Gemmataceae bacterium]
MFTRRLFLVSALELALTVPASAGIFFKSKAKPAPAQRVPELIAIVKTDADDGKRTAAAEELRQYDPKAFPEIVPVLLDVAQRDAKPEVRAEAVQSLGKLRPVSQEVGMVLEQLMANDTSNKVRWQARTSLWQYQLSGYRSAKTDGPTVGTPTSKEPPLADSHTPPAPPGPAVIQPPRLSPVPAVPAPKARPTPARPTDGGPILNPS